MAFPSDLALKGIYLLVSNSDWTSMKYRKAVFSQDGIDIKFVEYIGDDRIPDSWGDYDQGSVGTHSLIFEITGPDDEKVFVRKDGQVSSYGHESWEGPIYEVRTAEKTVTTYEKV